VIWVFVAFMLAGVGKIHTLREAYGTSSADVMVTARAIGAALAFPLVMLGNEGYVEPVVLLGVCTAAVVVLALGIWMIVRFDAPLRDPA
jgi:Zn-dependent membrane protease YugP